MTDYQLPFTFEPISFEYIDSARKSGETIDYCPHLREIWRLLLLVGGWGDAVNQATLAFLLYEDVATTSHNNTISKENKDPVRGRRGMIRLENILGGKRMVTKREAEAFYLALKASLGTEWSDVVDKERLVTLSTSDLFEIMIRRNLPWPADLSPAQSLQMLAMLQSSDDLTIEPVFADSMRAAVVPGHENEQLLGSVDVPLYQTGDAFSLSIAGLNPGNEDYIVVELCFDGVKMPGATERFEVLPHAIGGAEATFLSLSPGERGFEIGQAKGRFAFSVWAIPSEFDLLAQLPFEHESKKLSGIEAHQLSQLLREAMIAHGQTFRSAMHFYQV